MSTKDTSQGATVELGPRNERVRFDGTTFTLTFRGISGKTKHSPVIFDADNVDGIEYLAASLTKSGFLRFRLTGDIDRKFDPALSETTIEIPAPTTKKNRDDWQRLASWAQATVDASGTRKPARWVADRFDAIASREADRALVTFDHGVYLTGLPETNEPALGHLIATGNSIGIGEVRPTRHSVQMKDVRHATIDGGQSVKQILLGYLKYGVFNLLGGASGDVSYLTLELRSGSTVVYQVPDFSPQVLRAQLYPIFRDRGITTQESVNDAPFASDGHTLSVADELIKLTTLRDQGVLSDSEFAELKTSLLSKGY